MSTMTEGSVVTICFEIQDKAGTVRETTGTIFWTHQGKIGVLLPNGMIWYGTLSQVYPAQQTE